MANEQTVTVQGIDVPASALNDKAYFALTRRQVRQAKPLTTFAGMGATDEFQLVHDGVVAALEVRVTGTVVHTAGTSASLGSTRRWPYDVVRAFRLAANGQTNLYNASGLKTKALQMMYPDQTDAGITPRGGVSGTPVLVGISGANPGFSVQIPTALVQHSYLADAQEIWGFGSGCTAIAGGTYPVNLRYFLPVAYDQKTLEGAIFAQTEGTNLTLAIDWANLVDVLTVGGTSAVAMNLQFSVHEIYFDIPILSGKRILPTGIQYFHQVVQTRATTAIAQGDNEFILPGIARGRKLMRVLYNIWNVGGGTPASQPIPMNDTYYGPQGWIYGGNQNPERFATGDDMAHWNERVFDSNVGVQWGFGCWDFANEWAFRDLVDLGSTNDLRLLSNITTNVTLSSPVWEVCQQVLVGGPQPQA